MKKVDQCASVPIFLLRFNQALLEFSRNFQKSQDFGFSVIIIIIIIIIIIAIIIIIIIIITTTTTFIHTMNLVF